MIEFKKFLSKITYNNHNSKLSLKTQLIGKGGVIINTKIKTQRNKRKTYGG